MISFPQNMRRNVLSGTTLVRVNNRPLHFSNEKSLLFQKEKLFQGHCRQKIRKTKRRFERSKHLKTYIGVSKVHIQLVKISMGKYPDALHIYFHMPLS